jgi:hypothetical protein
MKHAVRVALKENVSDCSDTLAFRQIVPGFNGTQTTEEYRLEFRLYKRMIVDSLDPYSGSKIGPITVIALPIIPSPAIPKPIKDPVKIEQIKDLEKSKPIPPKPDFPFPVTKVKEDKI